MTSGESAEPRPDEDFELRLRALEVGLWDYDIDADLLVCDARWYQITGLQPNMVRSLADFRPFIHPEDEELATTIDLAMVVELIARDLRYHVDFRLIRPDGQTRWIRSVACLLLDAGSGHHKAVGCITDNTDFALIAAARAFTRPATRSDPDIPDPTAAIGAAGSALSEREIECLRWVSLGKTAWETATIMGRSQRTVEFHLVNATRKLSASNKIHAAVIAVRKGLI